ncbi:DUF723 domain-containing protein [Vibrio rotiferianus]|uniref:DUF723 domain-containing protein n=1 Tax=Vibrio rotiferianus TaxID=190895 RepID=A0A7Y3Z573_9VIBR|nr:DUF723 domain-containing protein [Vibrio rotiferianus]
MSLNIDSYLVETYRDNETGVLVKVYESCTTSSEYEHKVRELTNGFVRRLEHKWPDRFKFSLTRYTNTQCEVTLTCKKHLRDFKNYATYVMKSGDGCPECASESNKVICTESLVLIGEAVHGNRYDYSKTKFRNNKKKVVITCPLHGDFHITPTMHIQQEIGCPDCESS